MQCWRRRWPSSTSVTATESVLRLAHLKNPKFLAQSRLGNRRARIKPNIKRVIDYQCYSTQLQHRKKAELRALREQALELDEQVKLLLQRRQQRQRSRTEKEKNSTTQNEDDDSREWLKKAVGEFQKRQKAERTHRKLQEIWANQTKVNGAFRHLVQRRSLLYVGGKRSRPACFICSQWV